MTESTERVEIKSAWLSKINWGEAIKVLAMVSTAFFGIEISPEMQVHLLQAVIGLGAVYTYVVKTFFTNTITPSSAKV